MLFREARAPPTGRRAQGTGHEEVAQAGKGRAAGSQMVQEMPRVTVLPPVSATEAATEAAEITAMLGNDLLSSFVN